MDDIQLLLYIAFGVIYILSRAFRKKKGVPKDSASGQDSESRPAAPSFEDLLKEFTQGTDADKTRTQPELVSEPRVEEFGFEEELPSDTEIDEIYQESIRQAEHGRKKQALESKFKRFDVFDEQQEEPLVVSMMRDLEGTDGLKKAVIYKEILDRKY